MKKTLAAVAVLGAFAGSALAADVTVYGRIDTGLAYKNVQTEIDGVETGEKENFFSMDSGNSTGSRVGIKGSEQISEGLTAGFVLEKGFKGETGKGDADRDFDREASVYLKTDFGSIYAGRMGTLFSDSGSIGKYAAIANVDGTGHGGIGNLGIGILQLVDTRMDNTLAYVSPTFGGVEVFAQYSMGDDGDENESTTDRYASIGASYKAGGLQVATLFETTNEKSYKAGTVFKPGETLHEQDDMWAVHLGGTYDFGVAAVSVAGVYFDNADEMAGVNAMYNSYIEDANMKTTIDDLSGYGVSLGVAVPVAGGKFVTTAGYIEGDGKGYQDGDAYDAEAKVYNVGMNYHYPLSKQVKLYTGAGYTKYEADVKEGASGEREEVKVGAGMIYYF